MTDENKLLSITYKYMENGQEKYETYHNLRIEKIDRDKGEVVLKTVVEEE